MTNSIFMSFVVPSLVSDLELRRCVDSIRLVMNLVGQRCEILIVCPSCFVSTLREEYHSDVVVSETRKGIYSAMNDGIKAARGKYIYFIGKDDILLTGFKMACDYLIKNNVDMLSCDVYRGNDGIYSGEINKFKVLIKNLCHQGVIYRTELLRGFNGYVRKMKIQADHFMNIKIIHSRKDLKLFYLPVPICWYSNSGVSTKVSDDFFWRIYPLILKKYVGCNAYALLIACRFLRGKI